MGDIFTDLSAVPGSFAAPGMPEDSVAHSGMIISCDQILKNLTESRILERALNQYPDYEFVITGQVLMSMK